ncbi:MAG: MurT ligase domain-containing protein [Candidatus Nanosyncoccaceae bacterium]|jgi:UDP-N-acetylmuramyl tripeptide synthase
MHFRRWFSIKVGKLLLRLGRFYGGGSALPGLVMEKIHPNFVKEALENLPLGVAVISGTNGKTSTTKIVSQILTEQNVTVFTNPSGSNFLRGVASALLKQCDSKGQIKAQIAILELDEAHAIHFVNQVKPNYCLLLNVLRDQLDRFGEIDTVTHLLEQIARSTTKTAVINREDSRLRSFANELSNVSYYGYSDKVGDQLQDLDDPLTAAELPPAEVELVYHSTGSANVYRIGNDKISAKLKMGGLYNHFNVAGAIALIKAILGDKLDLNRLVYSLKNLEPAFGRGEKFLIGGQATELILVKNPSGLQMSINSLTNPDAAIMIAVNDNYADGRDTSWLWDVNFSNLPQKTIHTTAGSRCFDITNRLKYDLKKVAFSQPNLNIATTNFLSTNQPRQIFTTYTAMLQIRKILIRATKGEEA